MTQVNSEKTVQPRMATISAADLKAAGQDERPPRILDVRTPAEFESAHIPGSHNVPLDALDAHLERLAEADQPIVVVCQSGARADQACNRLLSAGASSLSLLDGGINAWRKSGGEVVEGRQTWALDRQVRFVAGLLVMSGLLLSLVVPGAQWFAGAIGFGLFFSAVTNTCAMGAMLMKLPYNRATGADHVGVDQSVSALTA